MTRPPYLSRLASLRAAPTLDDLGPPRSAAGDPRTPDDERDVMDLTRDERRIVLDGMTKLDLIEIIEAAVESVAQLRQDNARLRQQEGR